MEYCYSKEHGRRCANNCEDCTCTMCGKLISDCEWVVNWSTCSDCFSTQYDKDFPAECPFCANGDGPHDLSHEGKP